jgi:Rrf2 family transcriptional regulator, cysteine metabolism repressor
MKLITKNTDYAIRALIYLAKSTGGFIASRQIAEANHIPLMFMRRILQNLTQADFVESREGVVGGVRLMKNPKKIKIIDIIKLYQKEVTLTDCLFRKNICGNIAHCPLRPQLKKIEGKLIQDLNKLYLSDLLGKNKNNKIV